MEQLCKVVEGGEQRYLRNHNMLTLASIHSGEGIEEETHQLSTATFHYPRV